MNNIITKRKSTLVIGIILVLLVIGLGVGYYINSPSNLIALDVNPSIEIHTNRLNRVVSIDPINEDAKQLLAGYQIADRNLESVIKDIVDRMILSGYIALGQENKILVTVDNSNTSGNLLDSINNTIATYMQEKQINTDVLKQSLSVSAADTQTAHEINASVGKMAVINRLLENNIGLTAEELAQSSIKVLMKLALDNNILMEDLILNYSIAQEEQLDFENEDSLDNEDIIITQSEDNDDKEDSNTIDLMSSSTKAASNERANVVENRDSLDKVDIIITQSEDNDDKEDSNTIDLVSSSTKTTSNEDANEVENEDSQSGKDFDEEDIKGEDDSDYDEDSQGEEDNDDDEDSQGDDDIDDDEDSQGDEDSDDDEDSQGDEDSDDDEDSQGDDDNDDDEDSQGDDDNNDDEDSQGDEDNQ